MRPGEANHRPTDRSLKVLKQPVSPHEETRHKTIGEMTLLSEVTGFVLVNILERLEQKTSCNEMPK